MSTEVVILGAGLTGLSAAYHLKQPYEIFEKEQEVGGLCRSVRQDGFTFDFTGHLLHFNDRRIKDLIEAVCRVSWVSHQRKASIYTYQTYLPYPLQAHLCGLPQRITCECLLGLLRAHQQYPLSLPAKNFEDWVIKNFGQGIGRHFLLPYNQKVWHVDPSEMTSDWAAFLIPVPNLEGVVRGCFNQNHEEYGSNRSTHSNQPDYSTHSTHSNCSDYSDHSTHSDHHSFYYPLEGGIEIFGRAFLPLISKVRVGMEAVRIDVHKKRVWFQDGQSVGYRQLISSMPLPEMVRMIADAPSEIKTMAENLRYTSVFCLNLGVDREKISDQHWIYFPELKYSFYRVGFPSNFSSGMAPEGTSSLYAEISHLPEERIDHEKMLRQVRSQLTDCGVLRQSDQIITHSVFDIPYAYVTFDFHRQKSLPFIQHYLRDQDIFSVGRYGAWNYSLMGHALVTGIEAAREVNALSAATSP
jgi:protoporphyrinogen oxidase